MSDNAPRSNPAEQSEVMDIKEALQHLKTSIERGRDEGADRRKEVMQNVAEAKTKLFAAYANAIDPVTRRFPEEKMKALLAVIAPADALFLLQELSSEGSPREKQLRQDLEALKTEIGKTTSAEEKNTPKEKRSQAEEFYNRMSAFVGDMMGGGEGKVGAAVEQLKKFGITKEVIVSGILSVVVTILESVSIIPAATKLACDLRFMQLKKDLEHEVSEGNPKDPIKKKQLADLNTPAARRRFEQAYTLWMKGGKSKGNAPGLEAALGGLEPIVAQAKPEEADAGRKKIEITGTQEFGIHNQTDLQKIKITPAKDNVSLVIGDRKAIIEKIRGMTIARVEVLAPTEKGGTIVIFVLSDGTTIDIAATSISDLSANAGKQIIRSRKGDASIECTFTKTV